MKSTTNLTPEQYLASVDDTHRNDLKELHDLICRVAPDLEPAMCSGMIGYGLYEYRNRAGKGGTWFKIGLGANKASISIHIGTLRDGNYVCARYTARLPKASIGKGCVRFKKLADLDLQVLEEMVADAASAECASPAE